MPVDVLDGDGGVVHQDAHRQRQAAQGHDVERLAGRPQRRSAPHSTDSGIEVAMMTVERQLPRNSRIIRLVSSRRHGAFAHHAGNRRFDENGLVVQQVDLEGIRQLAA